MHEKAGKKFDIDSLLKKAVERWGEDEVELMKPALERIAKAIWTIQSYHLKPDEEPEKPLFRK